MTSNTHTSNVAPTRATHTPSIDGLWDCTVATPMGKEPQELRLQTGPGGALFGEMKSVNDGESIALENGRYDGNTLTWSLQLRKPFPMKLKVEVIVTDHTLSGHASALMIGKAAIEGTRRA